MMISDKSEVRQEAVLLCPSRLIHPYSPRSLQYSPSLTLLSLSGALNGSILDCAELCRLLRPEIMEQIMRADSNHYNLYYGEISNLPNFNILLTHFIFAGRAIQTKRNEWLPTD